MLQRGITLLIVIIGNAMYAAVAVLFLLPSGLPTGGTTGIALLVNRLTGLSVSMFVLGFNIVMLVVGFIFLGKKFAFTTIVSTFPYPICLVCLLVFRLLIPCISPPSQTLFFLNISFSAYLYSKCSSRCKIFPNSSISPSEYPSPQQANYIISPFISNIFLSDSLLSLNSIHFVLSQKL